MNYYELFPIASPVPETQVTIDWTSDEECDSEDENNDQELDIEVEESPIKPPKFAMLRRDKDKNIRNKPSAAASKPCSRNILADTVSNGKNVQSSKIQKCFSASNAAGRTSKENTVPKVKDTCLNSPVDFPDDTDKYLEFSHCKMVESESEHSIATNNEEWGNKKSVSQVKNHSIILYSLFNVERAFDWYIFAKK